MKELVALLQSVGYTNIRTYIQSGNVIFQSSGELGAKDAKNIGKAILDKMGFEPRVLLLNENGLRAAIAGNPYPTEDGKALHFFFLESQPKTVNITRLLSLKAESERCVLGDKVLYLHTPNGFGRSRVASAVESTLGVAATARNWNTIHKLASMLDEA